MLKIIGILFTLIAADFYLFPFEPSVLPAGINVKMILAGLALPLIAFQLASTRKSLIGKDFLLICLFNIPISLFSLLSNVYNNTNDYSFNFYFISVFVWMAAGYVVVSAIKFVHQKLSVQLLANYLIGVCCLQCILALCMEYIPSLKVFIDGMMAGTNAFMGDAGNRMHGLGCALDVAGGRFAAILVTIAFLLTKARLKKEIWFYIVSFLIILVIGNMIGRTATVGGGLALVYWGADILRGNKSKNRFGRYLLTSICITVPLITVLYFTSPVFSEKIRFGFEGFFSLAETGRWETNSNEILFEHMIVFPDNMKTWLIGDGYGANPTENDPYYTGKSYHGFYMGTDIGYLRFIFFFGLLGMFSMIALFLCFWEIGCNRFTNLKDLITLLLVINLIIWFKATSDLLPIFAILLCISKADQDSYEATLTLNKNL